MLQPNQYILAAGPDTYGLHTFKDSKPDHYTTMICQMNSSGDWFTVRPPSPKEREYFEKNGVAASPEAFAKLVPPAPAQSQTRHLKISKVEHTSDTAPDTAPKTCSSRRSAPPKPSTASTGTLSPAQKAWETRRAMAAQKGLSR